MAYGIEIKNNNGNLLIDQDYQSYFLVERRSVNLTFSQNYGQGGNRGFYPVTVNFTRTITSSNPPMIVMRSLSGSPISVAKLNGRPGNWTGLEMVTPRQAGVSSTSAQYEYECYVTANNAVSTAQSAGYWVDNGYGIIVNDSGGNRVFDSRMVNQAISGVSFANSGISKSSWRTGGGYGESNYFNSKAGSIVHTIPSNTFIDIFPLMACYGDYNKFKPYLRPYGSGNAITLDYAWKWVDSWYAESPGWYGTHQTTSFTVIKTRRQPL